MLEPIVDFFYWVMPSVTLEWEVMQRGNHGYWYRTGLERPVSDRQVFRVGPLVEGPREIRKHKKEEKKRMEEFVQAAIDAGFSETEANFMWLHLAKRPHTHETDEIIGLDELIEEAIEEASGDEEEEEEEE